MLNISSLKKSISPQEVGKHDKHMNFFGKKGYGFGKKSSGSNTDTEIGPWFRFTIPKPNFGLTLLRAWSF